MNRSTTLWVLIALLLIGCGREGAVTPSEADASEGGVITDERVLRWLRQAADALGDVPADHPARERLRAACHFAWAYAGRADRAARLRADAPADRRTAMLVTEASQALRMGRFAEAGEMLDRLPEAGEKTAVARAFVYARQDGKTAVAQRLACWRGTDPEHKNGRLRELAELAARSGEPELAARLRDAMTAGAHRATADLTIRTVRMIDTPDADWPEPTGELLNARARAPAAFAAVYARLGAPELAWRAAETYDADRAGAMPCMLWSRLAVALHESGQADQARRALARAVEIAEAADGEPGHFVGAHDRGAIAEAAVTLGRRKLALRILRARNVSPGSAMRAWARLGRIDRVFDVFEAHKDPKVIETGRFGIIERDLVRALLDADHVDALERLIAEQHVNRRIAMRVLAATERTARLRRDPDDLPRNP